ncbi:LiaF transmembrane domain-containing protein [Solibaculum mannosilyticum]|uniref:LiaF transmembrane domain-containing protein n=1 Tax=Solibaculum mannosilyticum TaxID=2780922 RepID=UPI0034B74F0C
MKRNSARILFGLLFIGLAVFVAGSAFGWWSDQVIHVLSESWWTLFIIVPGIAGIISSGPKFWNLLLIAIGVWLMAESSGLLSEGQSSAFFWAVVLLLVGAWLLVGWFWKPKHHDNPPLSPPQPDGAETSAWEKSIDDRPDYIAVFSGRQLSNYSKNLQGGKATAVFGGLEINMRDAVPVQDITLELTTIFGGIDLYVPSRARIKVTGTPVFGGFDSMFIPNDDPSLPLITIKCTAVFGGIDLK